MANSTSSEASGRENISHLFFSTHRRRIEPSYFESVHRRFSFPALIGKDTVVLSHLQYADDAVLIYNRGVQNILSIKRNFCHLELVSRHKVNFSKCKIFGVHLSEAELNNYAIILKCECNAPNFK